MHSVAVTVIQFYQHFVNPLLVDYYMVVMIRDPIPFDLFD